MRSNENHGRSPGDLLTHLRGRLPEMTELLRCAVELESPSLEKAPTDVLVSFIEAQLGSLGCEVTRFPQQRCGDHLLARWWPGHAGPLPEGQLLVLCHLDTVWGVGEVARRPFRVEDGKAYGPGAMDMKGGAVQALAAIEAMNALGLAPRRPVVLIFNTDEEIGSATSRPLIESEALKSRAVFVLEPAVGVEGKVKTFRKGVGMFEVRVEGRAAHAGADHSLGINSIEELAHQILRLQAMTDYVTGTTVNVGLVSGGTRRNVVPATARRAWT